MSSGICFPNTFTVKFPPTIQITTACLCLGLALGFMLTGGRQDNGGTEDPALHPQPTRRVVRERNGLGISKFLADNARHEALPISYREKRSVMHERRTSPFRLQAVLYHHMDNLSDLEVEELISNKELVSDREVTLAFGQIAQENPENAMDLCLAHSNNLQQKLLAMRTIYTTWARDDPQGMFDYIGKMNTGGERMIHTHHLHLAWLESDPGGMARNHKGFPQGSQRYVAEKGMNAWLKRDRQAALDFAASLEDRQEKAMFQQFIQHAEKQNP